MGEGNFNGLNCNWIPIKLETTKLKNFFVEITTYDCNHVVHKNLTLQQNASILDTKKNIRYTNILDNLACLIIILSTMIQSRFGKPLFLILITEILDYIFHDLELQ